MIDWARVRDLQQELGEDEFFNVVELFLDEIETVVMRLMDDDAARLEIDLHFLNGCAVNLGFRAFSRLCKRGEIDAAMGCADQVNISELLGCYADTKRSFTAGISRPLGARCRRRAISADPARNRGTGAAAGG